jgi:hypothetical protein
MPPVKKRSTPRSGRWRLQDAKARFSEVVREGRSGDRNESRCTEKTPLLLSGLMSSIAFNVP